MYRESGGVEPYAVVTSECAEVCPLPPQNAAKFSPRWKNANKNKTASLPSFFPCSPPLYFWNEDPVRRIDWLSAANAANSPIVRNRQNSDDRAIRSLLLPGICFSKDDPLIVSHCVLDVDIVKSPRI